MNKKGYIRWNRDGMTLRATFIGTDYSNPAFNGLKESDMDPVHEWCKQTECGTRTSFDTWQFRTEAEITVFLLRWS